MTSLEKYTTRLKSAGQKALVTYVMAGDPDLETSAKLLAALPKAGADIIELGLPFSDPMADGPVIQNAARRALKNGTTINDVFSLARTFRTDNKETPLILMGYYNPIFRYGPGKFCQDAADSGVDGLLVVDLPPEEAGELIPFAQEAGLAVIRMITPTSTGPRLKKLLEDAAGFLYYVSVTGITGTHSAATQDISAHIEEVRSLSTLPVAVGFGIKTPKDAAAMAKISDAIIVGSALVEALDKEGFNSCLKKVRALKAAL